MRRIKFLKANKWNQLQSQIVGKAKWWKESNKLWLIQ